MTRISVGVQSFDDAMLARLGRIHSADEARRAVDAALAAFDTVNLDLMYGLPGQDVDGAISDVKRGIACGVPHLSAYQLTIEPNTVFYSHPPALPEHDACADMQVAIEEALAASAFEHYETSAFARAGHRCRHNLNYWEFGDYLGIGAGAHGKVSFPDRVTRHERPKQPALYLKEPSTVEAREIAPSELPFEFMLNALRPVDGFPVTLFAERTGLSLLSIQKQIQEGERRGLLETDLRTIRPSERGRRFLNELLALFLPDGTGARGSDGRDAVRAIRIS